MSSIKFPLLFLFIFLFAFADAQKISIEGYVKSADDLSPLAGTVVALSIPNSQIVVMSTVTDDNGYFLFENLKKQNYTLKCRLIGFNSSETNIETKDAKENERIKTSIKLTQNAKQLSEVKVSETATRVTQSGDTSAYNASAYKVNRDANTEDLVTKMPGIVNENGTIKAQGEDVKRVLIDGKEYFGEDVGAALKNLPAEAIDKVQVFDLQSNQSRFSGFDDGNAQKTLNIITKNGIDKSVFGRVFAGYGYIDDSRYSAGLNVNWFNNDRRISIVGLSNNINIQNFSSQDLISIAGPTDQRNQPGFRGRGRSGRGNNPGSNFTVGQQNGISTTHSIGLNYSDVLGKKKKVKMTGSYFFNNSNNVSENTINRRFFNSNEGQLTYEEKNLTFTKNYNHRVNVVFQYDIDSLNSIIITPRFSTQQNNKNVNTNSSNFFDINNPVTRSESELNTTNKVYNFTSEVLYRHRFKQPGQTISISITPNINIRNGENLLTAINTSTLTNDSFNIAQITSTSGNDYGVNSNISFTTPISKREIFQLSYLPSFTYNKNERLTRSDASSAIDTSLSNRFTSEYMVQNVGFGYRFNEKNFDISVGLNAQYAVLNGLSILPFEVKTNNVFIDLLPSAMFNYKFKDKSNLRLMYRTGVNPPSLDRLQPVIDNSNPLQLSVGNADLKRNFSHFVMARYSYSSYKTGKSVFVFVGANFVQDFIGSNTFIAQRDTQLSPTIKLNAGAQLTSYVNLAGNMRINTYIAHGLPVKFMKSNLNLYAGFIFSRTPSLINNQINRSSTYSPNAGLVLSSNISEKIDFTISYNGTYNVVQNSLLQNNNSFFTHDANAKINWLFWKGFVFNSSVQNILYTGISEGFNQNIVLLNAALGYKFLKDRSLDVRIGVNDILNQNNSISRTISETYIEDTQNRVLQRFWMLTVTYNLRFFNPKSNTAKK